MMDYKKHISSCLIVFGLLFGQFLYAAGPYTSTGSGAWATDAIWSGDGGPPVMGGWPWDDVTIAAGHSVTVAGFTAVSGADLTINGTLTITGNHNFNNCNITIAAGGTLIVNGDLKGISNPGVLTNNGTLTVSGILGLEHSGTSLTNTGAITCNSFTSVGDITTSGTIDVTTSITYNNTTGGQEFDISGGTVTCASATAGAGSSPIINASAGTFQCNGDLDVTGGGGMASGAGGTINVTGDWNSSGSTNCTFAGPVSITGNLDALSSATLTFNGASTIGGHLNGTGTGTVTVGGTLDITGTMTLTNTSKINGTGIVGWGAAAVNNQTSDGRFWCNGTHYDTDPGGNSPDIPNNPINLGDCSAAVLPVELISFSAKNFEDQIELNWVTGSEINNSHFQVLGSYDGIKWEVLGTVDGAGNSFSIKEYSFMVSDTRSKYFKLNQVDFDGRSGSSKVISKERGSEINTISIFPNPVGSVLHISSHEIESGRYLLEIFNSSGIVVESMTTTINTNSRDVNLIASGFPSGVYLLKLTNTVGNQFVKRFVKQ